MKKFLAVSFGLLGVSATVSFYYEYETASIVLHLLAQVCLFVGFWKWIKTKEQVE